MCILMTPWLDVATDDKKLRNKQDAFCFACTIVYLIEYAPSFASVDTMLARNKTVCFQN